MIPQTDAEDGSAALTAHKLRVVRVCLGILAVLGTGSLVGVGCSLYLVNHYPLVGPGILNLRGAGDSHG